MSETKLTRRRFLQALPIVAGAVLASSRTGFADPAPASSPTWIPLGKAASFAKGSIKRVTLPPAQNSFVIFVNHEADGTFLALSAYCTHHGCVVDWNQPADRFICPCHHGQFDPTGKNISGPPKRPLPTLQTQVDKDGNLLVQSPFPAQG